jgi:hypothetical protein
MTTDRRRRAGLLVVLLAGLLGVALAAPAAAAEPPPTPSPTSSGKVGSHHLVDTIDSPGTICHYAASPNWLDRVHVEAPVAKARAGRTSQKIGFRFRLQAWNGTKLKDVMVSSIQVRTATPTAKAHFTDRGGVFDGFDHPALFKYRVRVDLYWYDAAGSVVGKASMWVAHYDIEQAGATGGGVSDEYCSSTTG